MDLSGINKAAQHWDNELCAEHDGSIASFSKLDMKIDDLSEYKKIFERDKYNLAKLVNMLG